MTKADKAVKTNIGYAHHAPFRMVCPNVRLIGRLTEAIDIYQHLQREPLKAPQPLLYKFKFVNLEMECHFILPLPPALF